MRRGHPGARRRHRSAARRQGAAGRHRHLPFRVVEWLPDDRDPRARIEVLAEPALSDAHLERLHEIDRRLRVVLRGILEAAGKDADAVFAALDIVDADPLMADVSPIYRWANRLRIEPHDQQRLLEAADPAAQLDVLDDVVEGLEARAASAGADRRHPPWRWS